MMSYLSVRSLRLAALAAFGFAFAISGAGCGDDNAGVGPDAGGHEDSGRIEIETRGVPPTLLATWTEEDGWHDPDTEDPLTELPTPVHDEAEGLLPLTAGGDRASLTVRVFDRDGTELDMATLSRDDETRERECTEFSARYFPVDNDTDIIAWPPIQHPDSPDGSFQFVELADGEVTGIFHCDHIHIYPETAGTVDVQVALWHIDHADDLSDPLTLRVEPAE